MSRSSVGWTGDAGNAVFGFLQQGSLVAPAVPLTEQEAVPGEDLPEPALVLHAVAPKPDPLTFSHEEHLVAAAQQSTEVNKHAESLPRA
jgi:hypothetical protein